MRQRNVVLAMILAGLIGSSLSGCGLNIMKSTEAKQGGRQESTASSEAELKEIDPSAVVSDAEIVTPIPAKQVEQNSSEKSNGKLVNTPFFTIYLPKDHADDYAIESFEDAGDLVYSLSLSERVEYNRTNAGFLYSINIYTATTDFTYLPSYTELGTLTKSDGTLYNVIREYPSDVQFSQDTREMYTTLAKEEESVLQTLTAKKGYTFTAGSCDHSEIVEVDNGIPDPNTPYYSDEGESLDTPQVMLENSSPDALSDADLYWMTPRQLRYAINEIYARHGRRFRDQSLQAWFDAQSWYTGTIDPDDFDEGLLTPLERANVQVLEHRRQVNSR